MYPHQDLTQQIIAAAIEVHRHLGPAYHESIYQKALAVELDDCGLLDWGVNHLMIGLSVASFSESV